MSNYPKNYPATPLPPATFNYVAMQCNNSYNSLSFINFLLSSDRTFFILLIRKDWLDFLLVWFLSEATSVCQKYSWAKHEVTTPPPPPPPPGEARKHQTSE